MGSRRNLPLQQFLSSLATCPPQPSHAGVPHRCARGIWNTSIVSMLRHDESQSAWCRAAVVIAPESKRAPTASRPCPGLQACALSQPCKFDPLLLVIRKNSSPLWGYPTAYYFCVAVKIGETDHSISDKLACSRTMLNHTSPRDSGHWHSHLYTDALQHFTGRRVA